MATVFYQIKTTEQTSLQKVPFVYKQQPEDVITLCDVSIRFERALTWIVQVQTVRWTVRSRSRTSRVSYVNSHHVKCPWRWLDRGIASRREKRSTLRWFRNTKTRPGLYTVTLVFFSAPACYGYYRALSLLKFLRPAGSRCLTSIKRLSLTRLIETTYFPSFLKKKKKNRSAHRNSALCPGCALWTPGSFVLLRGSWTK